MAEKTEAETGPIPDAIWLRVIEFLAAAKTGEVVLYVKLGRVVNARLTEHLPRVLDSA